MSTITGAQLRAARALIGITADELASAAGLGVATIRRSESAVGPVSMTPANARAAEDALRRLGVEMIGGDGHPEGVRRTG